MPEEQEVLLLPGLPLVNRSGESPEPGLWTFEVETARAPVANTEGDAPAGAGVEGGAPAGADAATEYPSVMIDYVHPGAR